jgi:hypothetical protein
MLTDLKISLVEIFHWSLYDIDQADFASTLKFMRRFTEMHGSKANPTLARKQVFCDQISWL